MGQRWSLSVFVPKGYTFAKVDLKGVDAKVDGQVLTLTMPAGNGSLKWTATFTKA